MKVNSVLSFFALYLVSGLNAQVHDDQSLYLGEDNYNLSPAQASYRIKSPLNRPGQARPSSARVVDSKRTQQSSKTNQHQRSQQQNGRVIRPVGNQQSFMGAARNRPVSKVTSGPARISNKPVSQAAIGQRPGSGSKQQAPGKLSTNSQGNQRVQQNGRIVRPVGNQQSFMGGARSQPASRATSGPSRGSNKPNSQAAIGQRPSSGSKQQVRGRLSTNPQISQKTQQSSRASQGQQPKQQSGRVVRPVGNQQRAMGAVRNRPAGQATSGPAQARNKSAGKVAIGAKSAASTKQQSNFDSLDSNQGNQEPSSQTTINQKPGSAPKVQAEPTSSNGTQGSQKRSGQAPETKTTPTANTQSTGKCRKIRDAPKMDIKKVLSSINKLRGELPPLNLNPALVKASILKATESSKVENALHSHSKECGFGGKSAIHYTTTAINEDDLLKKLVGDEANISKIKDTKFKAFGAAKVGTKWILTFGEE